MARRKKQDKPIKPIIYLKGQTIFPHSVFTLEITEEKALMAVDAALKLEGMVVIASQKKPYTDEPVPENCYAVGTLAKVSSVIKDDLHHYRLTVEGLMRAEIGRILDVKELFFAEIYPIPDKPVAEEKISAADVYREKVLELMAGFSIAGNDEKTKSKIKLLSDERDYGKFADLAANIIHTSAEKKQELLEEYDVTERLRIICEIVASEFRKFALETQVAEMVQKSVDSQQNEYFLREELKVIQEHLGMGESGEMAEYRKLLKEKEAPKAVVKKCEKEMAKLQEMPAGSPESSISSAYLDWVTALPWSKKTVENTDLEKAEKILDADHYGLEKVKERILEFLAVRKLTGGAKAPIICLVGAPGVGKTSVARSLANASGRNYVRISLGGIRDEAEIRGHRKTYIGAMPGRIISALKKADSSNPLILLDEIDKISSDYKGDPSAALLEVLDSEQNNAFRDHFIELDVDLSDVMFVTTANSAENIDRPLLDRMEVIEIPGYTEYDKINIAQKHLIPKLMLQHGLKKEQLEITDGAVAGIIKGYTREAGVRGLERKLARAMRKAASLIVKSNSEHVTVDESNLEEYLGKRIFTDDDEAVKNTVGTVNGLARTSYGGDTLTVEAICMEGKGKTKLTGSLGDVMKESAEAAVSYIRSRAKELGVDGDFYKNTDIHIHVPDGATPKDGPSAGITIATAVISALTGRIARSDIAMTGEITLRGRVLKIGGLREKSLAAYRAGIKNIVMPKSNLPDLEDIPADVRNEMNFIPVEDMSEVVKVVFEG